MGDGTNRIAKFLLPAVLGMTAGAVDVTGFLALGGLFTAHITGNLVILAAIMLLAVLVRSAHCFQPPYLWPR